MESESFLWGIRLMRALSASVEVTAAILLMRMHDASSMLRLNAILGLVGPIIFISVSAFGLAAEFGKINPWKFVITLAGVMLVIWGTRPN